MQESSVKNGQPEMSQPICLINTMKKDDLRVNQEALDILNSIKQPVVVVAIVGMYRTGKSYLMNRLAGKRTGFSLGSTIQAETKGIWMWCVPHPCRDNQTLVLLDTEGLGDVEKGDQRNDTWIFALAVLLSSTLVYNSMGTINNEAVMNLHYIHELAKHIKVKSSDNSETVASVEFIRIFPHFVWVVRDFMLQLELDGKTITADEYLENALKNIVVSDSNNPRKCIQKYFPSQKCFVFDLPASKDKLKKTEELSDEDLHPEFVEQTSEFCSYIIKHSSAKTIKGETEVTGSMFGNLAKIYVDAIRSGQVPCLENAVEALALIENSAAVEKSHALYRQLLEERVKLPTETEEELSSLHKECKKEALKLFRDHCFKDNDQHYQNKLKEHIKETHTGFRERNQKISEDVCRNLLRQLRKDVDLNSYMRPNGYADFTRTVDEIDQRYRATPHKGMKAEEELQKFREESIAQGVAIHKAVQELEEKERRLKEAKHKQEQLKREAELAKQDAIKEKEKCEEQKQIFERQAEMQKEVLNQAVKKKKNCVII